MVAEAAFVLWMMCAPLKSMMLERPRMRMRRVRRRRRRRRKRQRWRDKGRNGHGVRRPDKPRSRGCGGLWSDELGGLTSGGGRALHGGAADANLRGVHRRCNDAETGFAVVIEREARKLMREEPEWVLQGQERSPGRSRQSLEEWREGGKKGWDSLERTQRDRPAKIG